MAERKGCLPGWIRRILIREEASGVQRRDEPGRLLGRVPDAGRLRGPEEEREARERAGIVLPDPLPEPEDVDRVSREHDAAWREHFRDERDAD
jgi:hypothetical protein